MDFTTVVLIPVGTLDAERDLLAAIRTRRHPAAPVLDQGQLLARISASLEQAGHCVVVTSPDAYAGAADYVGSPPAAPKLVYAGPGVEPLLSSLAAGLCGTTPLPFTSTPPLPPSPDGNCAALVLIHPGEIDVIETAAGLAALYAAGIRTGLILVDDPLEARYAILKAALVDRVAGSGDFALLAPHLPSVRGPGAPACLCDSDFACGPELFERPHDILLLSGHATPIDANFGRSLIFCGRAGAEAGPSHGIAYPCRTDGACFRQRLLGRPSRDREGLVALAAARSALLILSGCNVAAIGRSWFTAAEGLAYQAQQTTALAAVVSTSMMSRRLELDLLLLALLAEGDDIATAIAAINRFRVQRLRHVTALPPGIGPSLVLGNPNLTVGGLVLHRVAAQVSADRVRVPLDGIDGSRTTGALLRADLPAHPPGSLRVIDRPRHVFCLGVLHGMPPDPACIYLWVATGRDGELPGHLTLEHLPLEANAPLIGCVESMLGEVPFWTVFLAGYVRQAQQASQSATVFETALAGLAAGAGDLAELSNTLRDRPGAVGDLARDREILSATWDKACHLGTVLLEAVAEIACLFGTVQSHGWDTRLQLLDPMGPCGPCLCGGGEIWGQRYRMPGGSRQRVEYQCASCGPIGEDDGSRGMRATAMPRTVAAGGRIVCEGVAAAPDDQFVLVRACLVLECWLKTGRMLSEPLELLVAPGEARPWTLTVQVPPALPAGVYPVAMLAIVNGALTISRQMVAVTQPAR